jgi:hypothetical protein
MAFSGTNPTIVSYNAVVENIFATPRVGSLWSAFWNIFVVVVVVVVAILLLHHLYKDNQIWPFVYAKSLATCKQHPSTPYWNIKTLNSMRCWAFAGYHSYNSIESSS